jgi:hypothetical protein
VFDVSARVTIDSGAPFNLSSAKDADRSGEAEADRL